MGISVDSAPSLRAFASGLGGVPHPLLADFHPKGEVLKLYGVYNEETGTARRSVFIIDKEGVIRWFRLYQAGSLPDPNDVLEAIELLKE